jgi:hypothetical protein
MSMIKAEEWVKRFNQEFYGMDEVYEPSNFMLKMVRRIQFDAALSEKSDIRDLKHAIGEE